MKRYNEYKNLDLPHIGEEILKRWSDDRIFEKSVEQREGNPPFVFYEGPPSANGMPGIHHVMSRTIKDLFCRYKTMKGFQVKRKAGWDTHGLPVELAVENELGITKEDIGKKISVEDYNKECRRAVMKYKNVWDDLTRKMGYWVDLNDPYITYDNNYIESVWYLLKMLYDKGLLYKGYSVQPYSPAAGTGLSSHELNLPGCYKMVTDTTVVAQFKIIRDEKSDFLFKNSDTDVYFLAWTTTPWTLPANTALAVGKEIEYILIKRKNQYTGQWNNVILASNCLSTYNTNWRSIVKQADTDPSSPLAKRLKGSENNKILRAKESLKFFEEGLTDFIELGSFIGKDLEGIFYEQLLPYAQPLDGAEPFRVVIGDFVSTEEGTGIVHIAPTFGADDMRVAKQNNISGILVKDENGELTPLVDKRGRFAKEISDDVWGFAGEYVKEEYLTPEEKEEEFQKQRINLKSQIPNLKSYLSVDERIALKLKLEGKAFRVEKYPHNYPHCWRTDKPVLYYPLDSWFIKTTAAKEKMIALNKTINWKPESTGTGRFGNWLENLQDWNLSRSRYWGIPLPVWRTEDGKEEKCFGSIMELKKEMEHSGKGGEVSDLHRPYVDEIVLISPSGKPMYREPDLIDVWFDSGAMPFAQLHYPFENKERIDKKIYFPADFIAEGVDQTRGWFFTLHAIAAMCFDSVAYKNVVSNGLLLDKNGQKMSKRLGNMVDPFKTIEQYGADATRWYLITNSQPWDNLKFDMEGIAEVQRKFFRALYNTYAFYALYANIDGFSYAEKEIPVKERTELDRWITSKLHSLIKEADNCYAVYEPTRAGRLIQDFVMDHLSNWYVRLSRRRFWKGEYNEDKISAYQTLYECLVAIAQLSAPIAPFFADRIFSDLNSITNRIKAESVHISDFPQYAEKYIDTGLEEKMDVAQKLSSMVLSLRKKQNIRVRQPLQKMMIPVLNDNFRKQLEHVKELILSEVNVKEMELLAEGSTVIIKKTKPNYKTLGPKYGKMMKDIANAILKFSAKDIISFEQKGEFLLHIDRQPITLIPEDIEIFSEDIPGWLVISEDDYTVALDITISEKLREEGIAREIINRIQNIRKEKGLDVTDKINLKIQRHNVINNAVKNNLNYICAETLSGSLTLVDSLSQQDGVEVEVDEGINTLIRIEKLN